MKIQVDRSTWSLRPFTPDDLKRVEALQSRVPLHPLLLRLLLQRGLSDEKDIDLFLNGSLADIPNPFGLTDMDRAVDRLILAMERHETVCFFGDYDVDGISGTAQMMVFCREIGLAAKAILPRRLEEGYGLTEASLKRILTSIPGLVVTIDNGTRSKNEITTLKERGIDAIIIDHH